MKRTFLILFIVGLAAEVAVFFLLYNLVGDRFPFVSSDAAGYMTLADGIAETGTMLPDINYLDAVRTPLYPMFVALFLKLFGSPLPAIIVQMIIGALMGPLVYFIGRSAFNHEKIAFLGALLFQLEPGRVFWTTQLMTDTLFAVLFLWAVYIFMRIVAGQEQWVRVAGLGAVLGAATLIRPAGATLWILFALMYVLLKKMAGVPWKNMVTRGFLTFVCGMFLVEQALVLPWMARNAIVYDQFKLSSMYAAGLFYLVGPRALEFRYGIEDQKARNQVFAKAMRDLGLPSNTDSMIVADLRYSPFFSARGRQIVRENFPWLVGVAVARLPFYLLNHDYAYETISKLQKNLNAPIPLSAVKLNTIFWVGRMLWFLVYVIVIGGASLLYSLVKKHAAMFIFFCVLMAFTTAQVIFLDPARYKLTVNPFLLLIFAFFAYHLWAAARAYDTRA